MKERPILFKGEMVRAILDGRKTQTRRIIKPQPDHLQVHEYKGKTLYEGECRRMCWKQFVASDSWNANWEKELAAFCPHGQVGDRLWVRETIAVDPSEYPPHSMDAGIAYVATSSVDDLQDMRIIPSIHMPRQASRITLEITGARVQQVQDISNSEALAEGVDGPSASPVCLGDCRTAWARYRDLWEHINGPGSWDANPWVWVIEFKQVP